MEKPPFKARYFLYLLFIPIVFYIFFKAITSGLGLVGRGGLGLIKRGIQREPHEELWRERMETLSKIQRLQQEMIFIQYGGYSALIRPEEPGSARRVVERIWRILRR